MEREGGEGGKEGGKFEEEVEKKHTVFCRRRLEMWPLPVSRAAFVRAARRFLPCSDSARERPSSQLVHGIALAALGERSTARPFDSFFGRRQKSSPSKKSDQIKPERFHFFFLPSLSLSSLALCVPSPPARGKRGTPSAWRAACPLRHRPLSPSSRTSSRALDEVVASAGPALRIRPKFFEGGWGNFFVDFSKDELVSSLSQFEEEKRLGFGAWLEDAERGPVLDVRERERERERKRILIGNRSKATR